MREASRVPADAGGQAGGRQGAAAVGGAGPDALDPPVRRAVHPTVASFFSGVGGMDLGLERAGWRIVSHSEIEPYPSAVLARHWPGVPNLGDITRVTDVPHADLWAGGPPCQGFSIAGARRGLDDHRSGLASTWLDLVERHRPGALLFENVRGILSSNRGLDWYAIQRALGDLGYRWAWRLLDGQFFGVPQRRQRVFLVALDPGRHPDPDGPGKVLAVGSGCRRDHEAEREAWATAAGRAGSGARVAGQDAWSHQLIVEGPAVYAGGGGATDGVAGRVDPAGERMAFVKAHRAASVTDHETWRPDHIAPTATLFDQGDTPGESGPEDPLLPKGLDTARYKAVGNGVIAPMSEWIGRRLLAFMEGSL